MELLGITIWIVILTDVAKLPFYQGMRVSIFPISFITLDTINFSILIGNLLFYKMFLSIAHFFPIVLFVLLTIVTS